MHKVHSYRKYSIRICIKIKIKAQLSLYIIVLNRFNYFLTYPTSVKPYTSRICQKITSQPSMVEIPWQR